VSIRPDASQAGPSHPEHVIVSMTCVSEGAVDVFVEPDARPRRVVVVGATPVADALARTALALDYEVVRVVDAHETHDLTAQAAAMGYTLVALGSLDGVMREGDGGTSAIVASQGHYDEQALETILQRGAAYVGLVASRTRGATVKAWLAEHGVPGVETIRNPAGLDLGARTAPEVALAILAEIVQSRPAQALDAPVERTPRDAAGPSPESAVDPVCRMDVEIEGARHTAEIDGTRYYFCCAQCRSAFLKDPAAYLTPAHD
jgi:xanthine dehydrogenase accessory factor